MMSSSFRDMKLLLLQSRCKGGSLPLKKRRIELISDVDSQGSKTASESVAKVSSEVGCISLENLGLAALSLAAFSVIPAMSEAGDRTAAAANLPEDLQELEDSNRNESLATQHNFAPLDQPLPGGCHGRTSRSGSFCRRHPCFNGSSFCKLHFQQHVLSGAPLGSMPDEDSSPCNTPSLSSSPTPTDKKQAAFQDKRYSGSADEIRCKATTTRGRECAYIAACGGKYCHLHSDYDNNPPPRRGGGSSKKTAEAPDLAGETGATENANNKEETTALRQAISFASDSSISGASSIDGASMKPKAVADRSKRRSTNAKLAKKHNDSPFPLLSMISTDQWSQKQVKISTGPLIDRVGIVERWSNGWVSVRVDGVGLHNRRSFELMLVEGNEDNADKVSTGGGDASRITPSPIVTEESSAAKPKRIKLSLKAPVTSSPETAHPLLQWPATPVPTAVKVPFVPRVTPNSPRRAMSTSNNGPQLSEGFLMEGHGDGVLPLQRRVQSLQQRLGTSAGGAFSSRTRATEDAN